MVKQIQHPALSFDNDFLKKLTTELSGEQQMWLSGFLYGISTKQGPAAVAAQAVTVPETAPLVKQATVVFGSQSGNSKGVARQLGERLEGTGWEVAVEDLADFSVKDLKKVKYLFVAVSTYGEGEPPAGAEEFHAALLSKRAPKLPDLKFAVLALGDRSYVNFCQTGVEFDERLAELGATRLADRVDCDVDFHDDADAWVEQIAQILAKENAAPQNGNGHIVNGFTTINGATSAAQPTYTRKNPYGAEVLEKIQLNGRGSVKETWHIELSIEGSGLTYEAGDALGIWPDNPDRLVGQILKKTGFDASQNVDYEGEMLSLGTVLKTKVELTNLTRDVLERHAEAGRFEKLKSLVADANALQEYVWGRDVLDLLNEFPHDYSATDFIRILRKLQPRLYSIASGGQAYPDEVHLTVGAVRYKTGRRKKEGAASTFLADRLAVGERVRVFIDKNEYFKLPQNGNTPIIMVGPGTGIAPFRAFLQDRVEREDEGPNWLFFGNPHFTTDFLYQTEWQKALKKGQLHRLNVAFSRDQEEKVYVQHKLLEKGEKVYEWLEQGAVIYVCGDKNRMAPDVRAAFKTIIEKYGGVSTAEAEARFKELVKNRRFLEDVY
ncbi:MAG: assimilatory sulfite reductase (NADPH) flavoprotein subunit [Bacteroidota bacterium]